MTGALLTVGYLLGAILNAILTYEGISERRKWWKIATTGLTAVGLLAAAAVRAGLLNLQNI